MYRHPHADLAKFMNFLNTALNKIGHSKKLCTVMGDFNLDLLQMESHNETDNFLNTLGSSFFYPLLKCYYDPIFTSWFFRCIAHNYMKEWKHLLPFANSCISSGDIQVWKMCKICKWDDSWCHTINPILHHLCKQSYLGQFAAQIIETWQASSFIDNTRKAIKHFVVMATHFFPVPTHLISICKCFSARKT